MTEPAGDRSVVHVVGLTNRFVAPEPARPQTRPERPPGYGIREQCLPFAGAAALGIVIPSPFSWGVSLPSDVPSGGRSFTSPFGRPVNDDNRVFYVIDDPGVGFVRNEYQLAQSVATRLGKLPMPGLSFFDRADQQSMIKIHLPYGWRSADGVDLLFTPPVNRPREDGFTVLSGLVEAAWYHNPVNLVGMIPPFPLQVHISKGEPIAQVIPVVADMRAIRVDIVESHRRDAREALDEIRTWHEVHRTDRSAYRRLSRSHHGRSPDD